MTPCWLIVVLTILARVGVLMEENHRFATSAIHVQGTVVQKFLMPIRGRRSTSWVPGLVYTYTAGNLWGRCTTEIEPPTYWLVHNGGPVPVAYLPGQPKNSRLDLPWENAAAHWAPIDDLIVAALIFVPGAIVVAHFGRRNRIHTWLLAHGGRAWGEVTAVRTSHHRAATRTYLTFRFTTAAGQTLTGRTSPVPAQSHWQTGDPIQVYYDPRRPRLFAVELEHPLDALDDEPLPAPFFQTIWA